MSFTNNNLAQEIINKFCSVDDRSVYIDYEIFKTIANKMTYDIITNLLVFNLKKSLNSSETFTIHLSLKRLTLKELDKHYSYITKICTLFKSEFPDKLDTCYIYNAPFVFSQIITIISVFIDRKTQKKIKLMASPFISKNNNNDFLLALSTGNLD